MRQPKQTQFAPRITVQKLTDRSRGLRKLLELANSRLSLTEIFNQSVPALFKNKFHVNGIDEQTLILTCHSASLMTRIRFNEEVIIRRFNQQIKPKHIKQLKIKIRPKHKTVKNTQSHESLHKNSERPCNNKKLSKKNAQLLLNEAEHTDDLELKRILRRLSQLSD